jgi:hypothetical protein
MTDDEEYSRAERIGALLGLLAVAAFAFVLADVLSGGRLTGRGCGCGDKETVDD